MCKNIYEESLTFKKSKLIDSGAKNHVTTYI